MNYVMDNSNSTSSTANQTAIDLDDLDRELINAFQANFPLTERPFDVIAKKLSMSEEDVIKRCQLLQENAVLSRIGAIIKPNTIGVSSLCAMAVAADKIDEVAEVVNKFSEVNHNYKRSHLYNLWFVVTAQNPTHLNQTLRDIASQSAHEVIKLPLEKAYYLNLGFDI